MPRACPYPLTTIIPRGQFVDLTGKVYSAIRHLGTITSDFHPEIPHHEIHHRRVLTRCTDFRFRPRTQSQSRCRKEKSPDDIAAASSAGAGADVGPSGWLRGPSR